MNSKSTEMEKNSSGPFVTTLSLNLAEKLKAGLIAQGFELSQPQYTIFCGKKKGITCTLYQSGKLTVQGKEMQEFLEFYLEPEILGNFSYTYKDKLIDTVDDDTSDITGRIGIDESGKGDFFGPLCVAGVFAEGSAVAQLKSLGVKDSKDLSDASIKVIAKKIRANFKHHVVKINPKKYNELYVQFANLNKLLAWGHATTIEQLVLATGCLNVIIDQFAAEHVVITALKRKKLEVSLHQRHRGEEDVVVAAASILAREAFLDGLEKLGKEYSVVLPKGASAKTIQTGKNLVREFGKEVLTNVGKLHFKTLDAILGVV